MRVVKPGETNQGRGKQLQRQENTTKGGSQGLKQEGKGEYKTKQEGLEHKTLSINMTKFNILDET